MKESLRNLHEMRKQSFFMRSKTMLERTLRLNVSYANPQRREPSLLRRAFLRGSRIAIQRRQDRARIRIPAANFQQQGKLGLDGVQQRELLFHVRVLFCRDFAHTAAAFRGVFPEPQELVDLI
jgi:hypothetical protein